MIVWIHCEDDSGTQCYLKAYVETSKPTDKEVKDACDKKFEKSFIFNVNNYKILEWCRY